MNVKESDDKSSLSFTAICERLNINVHYCPHSSAIASLNNKCCIFINVTNNK